jgi:hypothetical protein
VIFKKGCIFYMNGMEIWHENVIPEDPHGTVANRNKIIIYNVGISLLSTGAFPLEGCSLFLYLGS